MRETKQEIMAGVGGVESSKIIGPNTVMFTVMGTGNRVIRFHHTNIITFYENGDITLNSGGWKTMTTKARMNAYLPKRLGIWQERGIWYLVRDRVEHFPFQDGITIHQDGTVTGAGPDPKESIKLKKRIKEYVEGFVRELIMGHIPQPSGGDCWLCGLKKGNDSHLLSHIEEKYYVPQLLVNALEEIPVSPIVKHQVGYYLKYHADSFNAWGEELVNRDVKKSLTRYMQRHLGMAA